MPTNRCGVEVEVEAEEVMGHAKEGMIVKLVRVSKDFTSSHTQSTHLCLRCWAMPVDLTMWKNVQHKTGQWGREYQNMVRQSQALQ